MHQRGAHTFSCALLVLSSEMLSNALFICS